MLRSRWLTVFFFACAAPSLAQAGPPPQKLPVVKSGEMPFYPPLLRTAQVEGEVDLRVTTDGSSVVSVTAEYGNLLLVRAAQDNVRTWKFETHEPTSFSTVFSYHLDKELVTYSCDPDVPDNGTVILNLPAKVEITSHLRIRDCHGPNEGLDLTEPLRVFLTTCELDGSTVPCDKVTIRLQSGSLTVTPVRFKESEQRQGFVVPKELRSGGNFDLIVETETARTTIKDVHPNYLKGEWRIGIDHAPFKEHTPVYGLPGIVRCVGFVEFQWTEPGVVYWGACN